MECRQCGLKVATGGAAILHWRVHSRDHSCPDVDAAVFENIQKGMREMEEIPDSKVAEEVLKGISRNNVGRDLHEKVSLLTIASLGRKGLTNGTRAGSTKFCTRGTTEDETSRDNGENSEWSLAAKTHKDVAAFIKKSEESKILAESLSRAQNEQQASEINNDGTPPFGDGNAVIHSKKNFFESGIREIFFQRLSSAAAAGLETYSRNPLRAVNGNQNILAVIPQGTAPCTLASSKEDSVLNTDLTEVDGHGTFYRGDLPDVDDTNGTPEAEGVVDSTPEIPAAKKLLQPGNEASVSKTAPNFARTFSEVCTHPKACTECNLCGVQLSDPELFAEHCDKHKAKKKPGTNNAKKKGAGKISRSDRLTSNQSTGILDKNTRNTVQNLQNELSDQEKYSGLVVTDACDNSASVTASMPGIQEKSRSDGLCCQVGARTDLVVPTSERQAPIGNSAEKLTFYRSREVVDSNEKPHRKTLHVRPTQQPGATNHSVEGLLQCMPMRRTTGCNNICGKQATKKATSARMLCSLQPLVSSQRLSEESIKTSHISSGNSNKATAEMLNINAGEVTCLSQHSLTSTSEEMAQITQSVKLSRTSTADGEGVEIAENMKLSRPSITDKLVGISKEAAGEKVDVCLTHAQQSISRNPCREKAGNESARFLSASENVASACTGKVPESEMAIVDTIEDLLPSLQKGAISSRKLSEETVQKESAGSVNMTIIGDNLVVEMAPLNASDKLSSGLARIHREQHDANLQTSDKNVPVQSVNSIRNVENSTRATLAVDASEGGNNMVATREQLDANFETSDKNVPIQSVNSNRNVEKSPGVLEANEDCNSMVATRTVQRAVTSSIDKMTQNEPNVNCLENLSSSGKKSSQGENTSEIEAVALPSESSRPVLSECIVISDSDDDDRPPKPKLLAYTISQVKGGNVETARCNSSVVSASTHRQGADSAKLSHFGTGRPLSLSYAPSDLLPFSDGPCRPSSLVRVSVGVNTGHRSDGKDVVFATESTADHSYGHSPQTGEMPFFVCEPKDKSSDSHRLGDNSAAASSLVTRTVSHKTGTEQPAGPTNHDQVSAVYKPSDTDTPTQNTSDLFALSPERETHHKSLAPPSGGKSIQRRNVVGSTQNVGDTVKVSSLALARKPLRKERDGACTGDSVNLSIHGENNRFTADNQVLQPVKSPEGEKSVAWREESGPQQCYKSRAKPASVNPDPLSAKPCGWIVLKRPESDYPKRTCSDKRSRKKVPTSLPGLASSASKNVDLVTEAPYARPCSMASCNPDDCDAKSKNSAQRLKDSELVGNASTSSSSAGVPSCSPAKIQKIVRKSRRSSKEHSQNGKKPENLAQNLSETKNLSEEVRIVQKQSSGDTDIQVTSVGSLANKRRIVSDNDGDISFLESRNKRQKITLNSDTDASIKATDVSSLAQSSFPRLSTEDGTSDSSIPARRRKKLQVSTDVSLSPILRLWLMTERIATDVTRTDSDSSVSAKRRNRSKTLETTETETSASETVLLDLIPVLDKMTDQNVTDETRTDSDSSVGAKRRNRSKTLDTTETESSASETALFDSIPVLDEMTDQNVTDGTRTDSNSSVGAKRRHSKTLKTPETEASASKTTLLYSIPVLEKIGMECTMQNSPTNAAGAQTLSTPIMGNLVKHRRQDGAKCRGSVKMSQKFHWPDFESSEATVDGGVCQATSDSSICTKNQKKSKTEPIASDTASTSNVASMEEGTSDMSRKSRGKTKKTKCAKSRRTSKKPVRRIRLLQSSSDEEDVASTSRTLATFPPKSSTAKNLPVISVWEDLAWNSTKVDSSTLQAESPSLLTTDISSSEDEGQSCFSPGIGSYIDARALSYIDACMRAEVEKGSVDESDVEFKRGASQDVPEVQPPKFPHKKISKSHTSTEAEDCDLLSDIEFRGGKSQNLPEIRKLTPQFTRKKNRESHTSTNVEDCDFLTDVEFQGGPSQNFPEIRKLPSKFKHKKVTKSHASAVVEDCDFRSDITEKSLPTAEHRKVGKSVSCAAESSTSMKVTFEPSVERPLIVIPKAQKITKSFSCTVESPTSMETPFEPVIERPLDVVAGRRKMTARKSIRDSKKHAQPRNAEVPDLENKQPCEFCGKMVSTAQKKLYLHWNSECSKALLTN